MTSWSRWLPGNIMTLIVIFIYWDLFSAAESETVCLKSKIHELTDEMISQPSKLYHILQVIMSEYFPATCIQATVHYFGNLFP